MTDSNLTDVQIQNLLDAITDSVLAGEGDLESLTQKHGIPSGELQSMALMINQLNRVIVPVQPSQRFVQRLHQDLMGVEGANMLVRVRRLPPRVQLAAGIALVAGVMILSRRRAGSEARHEKAHERAAAQ
jgi:hypothetical protein